MNDSKTTSRGHRIWIPISLVVLAAAGITAIQLQSEMDRNFRSWAVTVTILLTGVLTVLWFALLSRIRWKVRLISLALVALVALGLSKLVRVNGTVDGRGLPRLAWKGSTEPARHFISPPMTAMAANPPVAAARADITDVPQFFGPNRDGIVHGAKLARDWSTQPPRELWRQAIGEGWSAFAVVGGRAFTQEQRGDAELVTCYELLTGRLLWAHTNVVRFSEWQGGDGPRATPTINGGKLFAIGGTGILDCLDADDGRCLWSRDVLRENQLPNLIWGVSCSPLVFDDAVVVSGGFTNAPTLLAYHRQSGEPLWRTGNDKASYASPLLVTLAGQRVVLSANAGSLTAHDPKTGRELLHHDWPTDKWPKAAQPTVLGEDRVFLSAGYGMGCEMVKLTAAGEGKLTAEVLWKNKMMKTQFNSVAVREGFLYGIDDGLLACVDTATGERRWKDGRYGSGQSLLVDDLILVQAERGFVALVEAQPEVFKELGRVAALASKTWNHPTLAGRYLLVRNDREAVCYELPVTAPTVASRTR